jgi:hypothetical protein
MVVVTGWWRPHQTAHPADAPHTLMCCPSWQVAETFAFGVDASGKAVAPPEAGHGPADPAAPATRLLSDLARLDTCVTVVDASNLLDNLHSLQTLKVCTRVWCVQHGVWEAWTADWLVA